MKLFRKLTAPAALLVISALLFVPIALAEIDAHKSFDMLKGLEGNWVGKNSGGQTIEVSFRMTAGGSALMSEIHGHGPENMITMFHLDGDRLLMTHYCGAGNQPRMKVVAADAKSVSFEFFDGTNIGPAMDTCSMSPLPIQTPTTIPKSGSFLITARKFASYSPSSGQSRSLGSII